MPIPVQSAVPVGARFYKRQLCIALGSLGLFFQAAQPAMAQALPNAGQLLNEQQRSIPQLPTPAAPATTNTAPTAAPGARVDSGLSVVLRSVRFSGDAELARAEDLQAIAAPSIGKTLGHLELQAIAEAATRQLRSRGYLLARAYLPRQDLTEGHLEIAVSAGRLQSGAERIVVNGDTRIASERLRAITASALPEGQALRNDDLERAVLLVNDLPGIKARSTLEPGNEPGTSRLTLDATEGALLQGNVFADNFGNRSTGSARVGTLLQLNDPLRLGDAASLGLTQSEGSSAASLNYGVPLTPSGLRLNAGLSLLRYRVVQDVFRPLDLSGEAASAQVGLAYPLLRTRDANLGVSAVLEHRQLKDEALDVNVRSRKLDSLNLSITGNRVDNLWGGGLSEGSVAATFGRADLSGNGDDQIIDRASARTDGSYQKLSLRASRLQNLGGTPGAEWSLYAGASGQVSSGNLDSSEKFILGGPAGVRAYPVGEAAGDQGVMGTLELRRSVALGAERRLQLIGFVDAGRINLHKRPWAGSVVNATGSNTYDLAAAGVGANLWVGQWTVRAAIAHTIGSNPGRSTSGLDADGRSSQWRGWVQAAYAF